MRRFFGILMLRAGRSREGGGRRVPPASTSGEAVVRDMGAVPQGDLRAVLAL